LNPVRYTFVQGIQTNAEQHGVKPLLVLLLFTLLTACASQVPLTIREPIAGAPDVKSARAVKAELIGTRVRWGGVIASVENHKQNTWVELVDRTLERGGRPSDSDVSDGRFIARIPGFLDPAIYAKNREMTVTGVLAESITRSVGDYPYRYPVVDVDTYYLWAKPTTPAYPYYYDPFWYDPWYSPRWYVPPPRPRPQPQPQP
jgi:outer membrane lipoprotein